MATDRLRCASIVRRTPECESERATIAPRDERADKLIVAAQAGCGHARIGRLLADAAGSYRSFSPLTNPRRESGRDTISFVSRGRAGSADHIFGADDAPRSISQPALPAQERFAPVVATRRRQSIRPHGPHAARRHDRGNDRRDPLRRDRGHARPRFDAPRAGGSIPPFRQVTPGFPDAERRSADRASTAIAHGLRSVRAMPAIHAFVAPFMTRPNASDGSSHGMNGDHKPSSGYTFPPIRLRHGAKIRRGERGSDVQRAARFPTPLHR